MRHILAQDMRHLSDRGSKSKRGCPLIKVLPLAIKTFFCWMCIGGDLGGRDC
jgi:hypothetical protein